MPPTLERPAKLPERVTRPGQNHSADGALIMPGWLKETLRTPSRPTAFGIERTEELERAYAVLDRAAERARAVLDRAARPQPIIITIPAVKEAPEPIVPPPQAEMIEANQWLVDQFDNDPKPPKMSAAAYARRLAKRMKDDFAAGKVSRLLKPKTIENGCCAWAKAEREKAQHKARLREEAKQKK